MNNEISDSSPALRVSEITGKGRGFVASQPLSAGQIILRDSPIVLYSALPFHLVSPAAPTFCHHCFRSLSSSSQVSCPECSNHHFCSPTCLSSAVASSHSTWVCHSLRRLSESSTASIFSGHPPEYQIQARFLVAAYNLAAISPSRFQILLSLHGGGNSSSSSSSSSLSSDDVAVANFLHSVLTSVCPPLPISVSPELTATLLAKDKLNAFGLMEPSEKRSVRAYGIYPMASFFNHDCLPNACRFDYVDTPAEGNTDIIVRMIHDVPEGREICLSYFPVNLNYACRQKRMLEDYGFVCDCDRCKVEANWSDNEGGAIGEDGKNDDIMDDDDDNDDEGDEEMDAEDEADMVGDESDFPHAYFFMRYMCEGENCWGTLAPLPPSDSCPSKILECNVCGNLKEDEVTSAN